MGRKGFGRKSCPRIREKWEPSSLVQGDRKVSTVIIMRILNTKNQFDHSKIRMITIAVMEWKISVCK